MSIKHKITLLLAVLIVIFAALTIGHIGGGGGERIAVGGKNFTEQDILGEMVALLVENNSDISVQRRLYLGGTMICFEALNAGRLDVYVEYTGTGLVNILDRQAISDPQEAYDTVKEAFREKYGLVWLRPLGFNNTYTLTMRRDRAEELGIEKISDIRHVDVSELTAGFDAEFVERPDGYPGLKEHYGFEISGRVLQMDPGLMYRAVADGSVDIICGFATDGRIAAYDLVMLEDDMDFFPPYYAAPLVREETLEEFPELKELLDRLGGLISDRRMSELNYQVDGHDRSAREVARQFLQEKGLIQ